MDPANAREAMREIALDLEEGADVVMVKPALAYLDVIREARRALRRARSPPTTSPASTRWSRPRPRNGWIDERRVVLEILTSIVRAGADFILTYHAKDAARLARRKATEFPEGGEGRRPGPPAGRPSRTSIRRLFRRREEAHARAVCARPCARSRRSGGEPFFVRTAAARACATRTDASYVDYVMSYGPLLFGHAPGVRAPRVSRPRGAGRRSARRRSSRSGSPSASRRWSRRSRRCAS